MKNNLRRNGLSLIVVSCLLYFLLLTLQPLEVHAYELVYTIQVSSLKEIERARKEYDFLIDKLNQEDLNYLRVEKIGQYYSVRLGKFADRMDAEKITQSVKRYYPSALIMKAYIKDERIIKLYTRTSAEKKKDISSKHSSIRKHAIAEEISADEKKKIEAPKPQIDEAISVDDKKGTEDVDVGDQKKADLSIKDERVISDADSVDDKWEVGAPDTGDQKKGDMYIKDGRLISAAEEYRNAIRKDPDNPDLIVKLANTLKKLRLLDQAIIQMKKAADASSDNNTTFRVELGKLYLTTGKPGKAKEQFLAAVKMNPGSADIHYYLGVVYMREADYEMAWFAAKTAQKLGYVSQDLINILSILSEEPQRLPWKGSGKSMYIRHIVVDTHEEAEAVLSQHSETDVYYKITDQESKGNRTVSKVFIGQVNSSNVHPKIARALRNQEVFADPVIVKTDFGFHIVQKIMPLAPYFK
jgi:tetratricopeptide (TPR) repeat protein